MTNLPAPATKDTDITRLKDFSSFKYYRDWAANWPDVLQDAINDGSSFDEYVEYILHIDEWDVKHGIIKMEETQLLKRMCK